MQNLIMIIMSIHTIRDYSAFHVLLLYDWLHQISVSFGHFFQWQFSHDAAWRNIYMN